MKQFFFFLHLNLVLILDELEDAKPLKTRLVRAENPRLSPRSEKSASAAGISDGPD